MSGPVLELIIFAAIAFFIINKLISTFGKTSGDDQSRNKNFFGENTSNGIKDVTYTASSTNASNILKPKFFRSTKLNLDNFENKEIIENGLKEVLQKIPSFNIERFLDSAKSVFKIILENAHSNDTSQLDELIDRRYINKFSEISASYGKFLDNSNNLSAKISEIYTFGNNIFIKIVFSGENITQKIKNLREEWTFSRSAISSDPTWYLTNIDQNN